MRLANLNNAYRRKSEIYAEIVPVSKDLPFLRFVEK